MSNQDVIGATQVIRCKRDRCDWESPIFRTPLSDARQSEITRLVDEHSQTHDAEQ